MKKSKKKPPLDKVKVSPTDRNIEVELLRGLDNLDLNAGDADDQVIEISSFQSITEEDSHLTRMVTLDDDKHSNKSTKSSRLSISPEETKVIINRKARHSGEYVAGSQDFLMHCHGISPQCTSDRPRPSRLNISNTFTPNCRSEILSPCTIDTQKTSSIIKPLLL